MLFEDLPDADSHSVFAVDLPSGYDCSLCGKSFKDKAGLRSHSNVHKEIREHVCPVCNASYKRRCNLYDHIITSHNGGREYPCPMCSRLFSRSNTLKRHMTESCPNMSGGTKMFNCNICQSDFLYKRSLDRHIRNYHS